MIQLRPLTRQLLLVVFLFVPSVQSIIGEDGLCSLYTFVHFTDNGSSAVPFWGYSEVNPGFNHMAAALLAMEHFNARNASVVPELANFTGCNIQFDMSKSRFFDTASGGHLASETLAQQTEMPCAIAGPFHDEPGLELSTFATALKFPLVAHRAFNIRLSDDDFHPYSSQVYPEMFASASVLVDFLIQKGRTDYINFLYAFSDAGLQRRETMTLAFDVSHGMKYETYAYMDLEDEAEVQLGPRDIFSAMKRMKQNGYRTIVVAMEHPSSELPLIANAAEALGMNNGDYFWAWFGLFETFFWVEPNDNVTKLVAGSAWLTCMDWNVFDEESAYFQSWSLLPPDFLDRLNAMNPMKEGEPGHFFANSTFFQYARPEFGSGFLYDAIMTIGMGACLAKNQPSVNGTADIDVAAHVNGIRSVDFSGVSGPIKIQSGPMASRLPSTVLYAAFNFFRDPMDDYQSLTLNVSDVYFPNFEEGDDYFLFEVAPFVFADGTTEPPELLRDTPEQNYLNNGLRAFGLALMSVAILTAILTAIWVFVHRKHAVLRAAQPNFLYVLAFGSAVTASGIFTLSFDEGSGWSVDPLGRACMATPWLVSLGYIITYGALFAKLWRVNRVLQFTRRKVDVRHVVWPSMLLFLGAIIVLSVWTAVDPLKWEREEVNEVTGESIGECKCDHFWSYFAPLIAMLVLSTVMAGVMAWKTKDVDEAYSESKWIFILILVQIEVIFVATPIVSLLYDTSANGRYIGLVIMIWVFPMSTMCFVMIPKVIAYRKAVRGIDGRNVHRRGERAHGRVTGASSSTNDHPSRVATRTQEMTSRVTDASSCFEENRDKAISPVVAVAKLVESAPSVAGVSGSSSEEQLSSEDSPTLLNGTTELDPNPSTVTCVPSSQVSQEESRASCHDETKESSLETKSEEIPPPPNTGVSTSSNDD